MLLVARESKAVRAICRQAEEPVDNSSVPRSLFTTPEIASFGLSEEEAVQQGYDISVGQLPYVYNGRAIASNSAKGFVKIVSEKSLSPTIRCCYRWPTCN